ncbi:AraC family transcriptional regulator [Pseudomonas sp. Marseille-Q5117]|uniref:AraC family transcriptional regulator n=1 Tax=Pseudomonas sp. Marseille-Q5117 TaxID=2972777 RepID=UPI0021C74C77|nr:helix-turn-helix transcriptional regulator [Pseudomonas sp. Marseille-Q5117]
MTNHSDHHKTSEMSSVSVGIVEINKVTSFSTEQHAWGQFVYLIKGVIELTVENNCYAAPPDFGIWLPPNTDHLAWADNDAAYFLLNVEATLCKTMPTVASIISVGPIAKAILLDLKKRGTQEPENEEDSRLMRVLIDQLSAGSCIENFLPMSNDPALKLVLEVLLKDPGNNRSLLDWSRHVNSTERTLARRCDRDLGMSFIKWKQRLRLSRALAMLSDGLTVQSVAKKLGYSTPSAFIAMFQKAMGATPNAFRSKSSDNTQFSSDISKVSSDSPETGGNTGKP